MMDNYDRWMYYHDEVVEQIDPNSVLNATESICSALGFKLGKSWEVYANELLKMPWTSIYLASLELDVFQQGDDLQSHILYARTKWTQISYTLRTKWTQMEGFR